MREDASRIAQSLIDRIHRQRRDIGIRMVYMDFAPDRHLLPNQRNRSNHFVTAGYSAKLRTDAKAAAVSERSRMGWHPLEGPVSMFLHIAWPYRIRKDGQPYAKQRMPDADGLATAHKPALDGYVDARLLHDDDQVESIHVTRSRDVGGVGYTLCILVPYLDGDIVEAAAA
ncbi:MAG: hypothetical protein ACR2OE_01240 [Thermomicrobiales bacterium]